MRSLLHCVIATLPALQNGPFLCCNEFPNQTVEGGDYAKGSADLVI